MKQLILVVFAALIGIGAGHAFFDDGQKQSLFVHSVYFWLKEDVTAAQYNEFVDVLRGLEQIKSVQAMEVGQPAGTPRDVVDNSYDVALLVYFNDRAGHDLYQADTIHSSAVAVFEDWIEDIVIYDTICERQ